MSPRLSLSRRRVVWRFSCWLREESRSLSTHRVRSSWRRRCMGRLAKSRSAIWYANCCTCQPFPDRMMLLTPRLLPFVTRTGCSLIKDHSGSDLLTDSRQSISYDKGWLFYEEPSFLRFRDMLLRRSCFNACRLKVSLALSEDKLGTHASMWDRLDVEWSQRLAKLTYYFTPSSFCCWPAHPT